MTQAGKGGPGVKIFIFDGEEQKIEGREKHLLREQHYPLRHFRKFYDSFLNIKLSNLAKECSTTPPYEMLYFPFPNEELKSF